MNFRDINLVKVTRSDVVNYAAIEAHPEGLEVPRGT